MSMVTKIEKHKLKRKLWKIELKGLLSYKEYLTNQYVEAVDKKSKKKYARYVEEQVVVTDKKISKLKGKLA